MGLDSQRDELRGACSPDAFQRRSRQPRESSLPRLVNKLCRLFSNSSSQPARHGKASRKRPSASRSLSASASPKKMPCPHQRLRKSCSADCSDASRVSRKSAQHISPPAARHIEQLSRVASHQRTLEAICNLLVDLLVMWKQWWCFGKAHTVLRRSPGEGCVFARRPDITHIASR